MKTRITEMLGIEYPIIQGGMAWVAEHNLAAAVSEAGGLGLIGGANAPGEVVREEIRKARELTKKPFGVLLISCLSTRAFRAVFTLLVAGRWWVMMNCWLSGEETICSLAIANKSNCWFSVSHAQ